MNEEEKATRNSRKATELFHPVQIMITWNSEK